MTQIEIDETIPEGRKRFVWPWDALKSVGEYFVVKDPKNVRNGRQSVFQANESATFKKFVGRKVTLGYMVERIE